MTCSNPRKLGLAESPAPAPPRNLVFRNARVVLPHTVTGRSTVAVANGRISRISTRDPGPDDAVTVDAKGLYLAPGLIDIHCHGDGENFIFGDTNLVARTLAARGTTGVLATLGATDMKAGRLHQQIDGLWNSRDELARRSILGVHLEGPYLNRNYIDVRRHHLVYPPNPSEYMLVLEQFAGVVRLWTCAPELEGTEAFVEEAAARGVLIAAGHTEAGADILQPLVPQGLRVATHWTNACGSPKTRFDGTREPGIDELAMLDEEIMAEVICDSGGCHVRPMMLKILYRIKGADGIILISDASYRRPGSLTPPDPDPDVDVNISALGALDGSRLSLLASARNFLSHVGCSLPEIFRMGSLNPARLFGWSRNLGSVEQGKLANLILVDDRLNLHGVWLNGEPVLDEDAPTSIPMRRRARGINAPPSTDSAARSPRRKRAPSS